MLVIGHAAQSAAPGPGIRPSCRSRERRVTLLLLGKELLARRPGRPVTAEMDEIRGSRRGAGVTGPRDETTARTSRRARPARNRPAEKPLATDLSRTPLRRESRNRR